MSYSKVQSKAKKIPCMKILNKSKELKILEAEEAKEKSKNIKLESCHLACKPISPYSHA